MSNTRTKPAIADSYKKIKLMLSATDKTKINKFVIGHSFFRKFVCTPGCTACCLPITLDFTKQELNNLNSEHQLQFSERKSDGLLILTSDQTHRDKCTFLTKNRSDSGLGCSIFEQPPLTCISFPQVRFVLKKTAVGYLLKKPYSRIHLWKEKPQCQFHVVERVAEIGLDKEIEILKRWLHYSEYVGIETVIQIIIDQLLKIQELDIMPHASIVIYER